MYTKVSRAEAKLTGAKRYFTGKPCKYGHIVERFVANETCVECNILKTTAWRRENPEIAKAGTMAWRAANSAHVKATSKVQKRAWYMANLESHKAKCKVYYEGNAEARKAAAKAWRIANPEAAKAATTAWRADNPERVRGFAQAWCEANPEKRKANRTATRHRRRSQKAGGMTGAEQYDWANSQAKVCFWCDKACPDKFHVDHILPLSKGGQHVANNLVISCPSCNCRKGAKLPEDFLEELLRGAIP